MPGLPLQTDSMSDLAVLEAKHRNARRLEKNRKILPRLQLRTDRPQGSDRFGIGKDRNIIMYRIGIGHDTHRLGPGTEILLGGVRTEHQYSLIGHSDADVLLHAITDAILGALALGDIGEMFPDSDPKNKGRSSVEMLLAAYELVKEKEWTIANLDCIIFAEQPKLGPIKQDIRHRIAEILTLGVDQVGVKAKTGEKIGPIGRSEAISAEVVVLIENGAFAIKGEQRLPSVEV